MRRECTPSISLSDWIRVPSDLAIKKMVARSGFSETLAGSVAKITTGYDQPLAAVVQVAIWNSPAIKVA
jgi:hypothetical protein